MPTVSSSSAARCRACSADVPQLVDPDRLGELVADGVHRVQRVHRALEDNRDPAPAPARSCSSVMGGASAPSKVTEPVTVASRLSSRGMDRASVVLPARLPGQAQHLASVHGQAGPVDRGRPGPRGVL